MLKIGIKSYMLVSFCTVYQILGLLQEKVKVGNHKTRDASKIITYISSSFFTITDAFV